MNHARAILLTSTFIVLGGCAHSSVVTTPVTLTVTSTNATRRFVSDVRKETLSAISKYAPNAHPLTVTVDLGVTTETVATSFNSFDGGSQQRMVHSTSPDPTTDGALPTVPDNGAFVFPQTMVVTTAVNVSYAIKDAGGRVVESDKLRFDLDSPISRLGAQQVVAHESYVAVVSSNNPFEKNRVLVMDTALFLASRVKALSKSR
jgi:hypothetical protein